MMKNIVDTRKYLIMHLLKRLMFIRINCITTFKYAKMEPANLSQI